MSDFYFIERNAPNVFQVIHLDRQHYAAYPLARANANFGHDDDFRYSLVLNDWNQCGVNFTGCQQTCAASRNGVS